MNNFEERFTDKAATALRLAQAAAMEMGHNYIGTEHLLLGLIREGSGVASDILSGFGVTEEKVLSKIRDLIEVNEGAQVTLTGFTPRSKKILEIALVEAGKAGSKLIGTEHLLLAIVKEGSSVAVAVLSELGVNGQALYNEIIKSFSGKSETAKKAEGGKDTPTLNQFGRDLTILAKEGKFDPVIGRDKEIERVVQILSRRTNPAL